MTDTWVGEEEFGLRLPCPLSSKFFQCQPLLVPTRQCPVRPQVVHSRYEDWTCCYYSVDMTGLICPQHTMVHQMTWLTHHSPGTPEVQKTTVAYNVQGVDNYTYCICMSRCCLAISYYNGVDLQIGRGQGGQQLPLLELMVEVKLHKGRACTCFYACVTYSYQSSFSPINAQHSCKQLE